MNIPEEIINKICEDNKNNEDFNITKFKSDMTKIKNISFWIYELCDKAKNGKKYAHELATLILTRPEILDKIKKGYDIYKILDTLDTFFGIKIDKQIVLNALPKIKEKTIENNERHIYYYVAELIYNLTKNKSEVEAFANIVYKKIIESGNTLLLTDIPKIYAKIIKDEEKADKIAKSIFEHAKNTKDLNLMFDVLFFYNEDLNDKFEVVSTIDEIILFLRDCYYIEMYLFIFYELNDIEVAEEFKKKFYGKIMRDLEICDKSIEKSELIDIGLIEKKKERVKRKKKKKYIMIEYNYCSSLDFFLPEKKLKKKFEQCVKNFIKEFSKQVKNKLYKKDILYAAYDYENNKVEISNSLSNMIEKYIDLQDPVIYLLIVLKEDFSNEELDRIFILLYEHAFRVYLKDDENRIIHQRYEEGEYDTGYFESGGDDFYVITDSNTESDAQSFNEFSLRIFNKLQDTFENNLKKQNKT